MRSEMENADILLKNAVVLTMDEALTAYSQGAIAIKDNQILAVGEEKTIIPNIQAKEIIDCNQKVLMPGFINAHTHVPMNLVRGLANDLRLDVWLLGYIMPVEREFVTPDFVRLGTKMACAELIRTGVTCFMDMYYFEEIVAEATAEIGMRAVLSQSVLKYPTPDAHSYEEALEATRKFAEKWKGHHLIVPSVAPHAPYTCPPEILKAVTQIALEFDIPLHIHIAETAEEVENMRRDNGMPVVPYVKKLGVFEAKTTAAHCVHIDEGEMRTLQHADVGISHNPSSNLKLASGIAPIKRMLELGVNVGIGTDGAASNNDLDFFEEIRLASFLAKGSSGDPTAIPAAKTLELATRIGAKAIHMDHLIGSLEKGKRADIILIDIGTLHNSPQFSHSDQGVYAQIVYACKSTDVTDVMIDGKWLMREREIDHIDEKELITKSREYAERIDKFISTREKSVLSKLIAIGGASQEESFEVQLKVMIKETEPMLNKINHPDLKLIRKRHYREYDTYFAFGKQEQNRVRFREDHFVEENGTISKVRSRLTLIGPTREEHYPQDILLSRSRYFAPANQSLRFYKEYFKPVEEIEIEKERLRYLIEFQGEEFFINIDHILKPELGFFLEIKTRTWSQKDAQEKADKMERLIEFLGASKSERICKDYIEIVEENMKK